MHRHHNRSILVVLALWVACPAPAARSGGGKEAPPEQRDRAESDTEGDVPEATPRKTTPTSEKEPRAETRGSVDIRPADSAKLGLPPIGAQFRHDDSVGLGSAFADEGVIVSLSSPPGGSHGMRLVVAAGLDAKGLEKYAREHESRPLARITSAEELDIAGIRRSVVITETEPPRPVTSVWVLYPGLQEDAAVVAIGYTETREKAATADVLAEFGPFFPSLFVEFDSPIHFEHEARRIAGVLVARTDGAVEVRHVEGGREEIRSLEQALAGLAAGERTKVDFMDDLRRRLAEVGIEVE